MPVEYNHDHDNEVTLFGATNFRNQLRRFGIKTDDRRRHMYVIGKTGMGKTTLLENMVLSDVMAGHGVCYVDPHGDTAEKLLDYIPSNRINDVVYFNPADMEYPVGFNILETAREEQKHLVASGLMGVFKKIWPDVWSPRMEYILLNCVLALLDYPGATLLGINRLLVDKEYRTRVIAKIRNPIVKTFWLAEFTSWSEKYATEAIAPVQNKVGQFLSASIIRNIVAQVKSSINPRQIMDEGKIFIVNLSKGKIGEDNMRLLGGMIVTKIQLAAMERVDIKHEADRRDFYLYVDEFQNFANESFASILSEARKYRLNLIVAHQYIAQLEEPVAKAVFGNVGTLLVMRVGAEDASFMEQEFMPVFTPEDLVNLPKFQMYMKLMVDGVATQPFSASSLAPIAHRTNSEQKVIAVSRERYAEPRPSIEEKVLRWSGMEAVGADSGVSYPDILTDDEKAAKESLGGLPASMIPGTPEHAKAGIEALEGKGTTEDTGEYLRLSPERLSAISKPPQPGKKEKPKFSHTCTRCGKTWDMPIQLDTSRPIYCAECMPIVREERKTKKDFVKTAVSPKAVVPDSGVPMYRPAPMTASSNSVHATSAPKSITSAPTLNKPRIIAGDRKPQDFPAQPAKGRITIVRKDHDQPGRHEGLLDELERSKGKVIETNKKKLEFDRMGTPPSKPALKSHSASSSIAPAHAPRSSVKISKARVDEPLSELKLEAVKSEPETVSETRSATVFKTAPSSVRPHGPTTQISIPKDDVSSGQPKTMKPGEKISFDE